MTEPVRMLSDPLVAQIMQMYGSCALLRLYHDEHLREEPSAASRVVLLNLGPAHALLESVTLGWFDGAIDQTTYFPFGTVIVPGEGKDLLSTDALPEVMSLMGDPVMSNVRATSRAFRLHARVAIPTAVLDVHLIVKPLAISVDGGGYFGVVEAGRAGGE
ncbi:hypothetical protein [Deinococcus yunweiensis]|uniref:hypothetical protein n=1 Tax=Deinococcus yunweiensis TaxID=367282 RepID=UPI00398EE794